MQKQSIQAGVTADLLKSVSKWFKPIANFSAWMQGLASPIRDFGVDGGDVDVDEDKGIVVSKLDLHTVSDIKDAKGNPIYLTISLAATNVKEIVEPFISPILKYQQAVQLNDGYTQSKVKPDMEAAFELLNDPKYGWINTPLPEGTAIEKLPKQWQDFAKELKFSLKCESPGRDIGEIDGTDVETCVDLINEYLVKVGITEFVYEVAIDANQIVLPVLTGIRDWIGGYVNDLKNRGDQLTSDSNGSTEADNSDDATEEGDVVENTKRISVRLRKITGSQDIELMAIKSNYAPGLTLSDVETILDDSTFLAEVTEAPQSFTITTMEDEYDIEPSEDSLSTLAEESLTDVFAYAIKLYRNLYMIHWLSYGDDMMKLHTLAEDLYSELIVQVDALGELIVEQTGTIPDIHQIGDVFEIKNYTFQEGIILISDMIQQYIDYIDVAYINQNSDVQSTLDEWLRYWTKQMDYFLKRQISE